MAVINIITYKLQFNCTVEISQGVNMAANTALGRVTSYRMVKLYFLFVCLFLPAREVNILTVFPFGANHQPPVISTVWMLWKEVRLDGKSDTGLQGAS